MDSGASFSPSFVATYPMMPTHFMGTDPFSFYNGVQNYNTQSTPWVSSNFSIDMSSLMQSSPWSTYTNPSMGSEGIMASMPTSSFDMSLVPMGGWNLPPFESHVNYALPGASAQIGSFPTYYAPPTHLSPTMSIPSKNISMTGPHMSSGISYGENQFYGSGYPIYETPSQGGNIYHHLNNSYPTSIPSQALVMMLVQTSSEHFSAIYHPSGQGQGVHQDPSWLAIFQNQSFLGPWNQIPPSITVPVTVSHTGSPSPTFVNHVGDGSTFWGHHPFQSES
jgi:hypothetical protein